MNLRRYQQIPWADRGRDWHGVDCWGLVWLFYREEAGIELPSYAEDYASAEESDEIARLIAGAESGWILVDDARLGDVVVFLLPQACGLVPCHLGVVITPGDMLHTTRGGGSRLQRYGDRAWPFAIHGIFRHSRVRFA